MIIGICAQKIMQGKTYSLRLKFDDINLAKISKMWFSCSALNILQEMTLDSVNKIYAFELTWQQTQALTPCNTNFNITVKLSGSGDKRDLANGIPLTVLENNNPVPGV